MWIKQRCNRKVRDFAMALRARKVSRAFEKRPPDHRWKRNWDSYLISLCHLSQVKISSVLWAFKFWNNRDVGTTERWKASEDTLTFNYAMAMYVGPVIHGTTQQSLGVLLSKYFGSFSNCPERPELMKKWQAKQNKITKQTLIKPTKADKSWEYGNPKHLNYFLPLNHEKRIKN